MVRSLVPVVVLLGLAACESISYDEASPVTTPEPAALGGVRIPDSVPMRDDFTTYLKVVRDGLTVGYVVRYDPLPAGSSLKRAHREGTMFVENGRFERIGFITYLGRGYRYRGADAEEIGQGTLEQLLPHYFGAEGALDVSPLRDS